MAADSIRVEYTQDLKPLEELRSGVQRAGAFFVSGTVEVPMPKIEVEGVGVLSFPVPPAQIAALVQQATRAPGGVRTGSHSRAGTGACSGMGRRREASLAAPRGGPVAPERTLAGEWSPD